MCRTVLEFSGCADVRTDVCRTIHFRRESLVVRGDAYIMEYIVHGRNPESFFRFFEELSQIPRGSGNESGAADYVSAFAASRGLECYRDEMNNVLIKKPASSGYETHSAVLLQGHLDMVCVARAGVSHDFTAEPLRLVEKNGFLSAEGTTLGGDDGFAVATMLALLDDHSLVHPPLECLFTVGEETGLVGALGFDVSLLSADKMINLDSEEEHLVVNGCVGSADYTVRLKPERVELYGRVLDINIGGFSGGHSGGDIDRSRVNALRLFGRLFAELYERSPFNLVSINSGSVSNAIPCELSARIAVSDEPFVTSQLEQLFDAVRAELPPEEKRGYLRVECTKASKLTESRMLTFKSTSNLLSLLALAPCGVTRRSCADPAFVEASANIASAHVDADGDIVITLMYRSSDESMQDHMRTQLLRLCRLIGAQLTELGRYPGWSPVYDTELQRSYISAFLAVNPEYLAPEVKPIHAGLECGVIAGRSETECGRHIECISIGPDIFDIHTPSERMDIDSCERVYAAIAKALSML